MKQFIILSVVIVLLVLGSWWLAKVDLDKSQSIATNYDGIWSGNFDINGRGNYQFNALYVGNELIAYTPDARASYRGTVDFNGSDYRSYMRMYLLVNGSYFDSVTLNGKVISPNEIEAQFLTTDAADSGTLKLRRDKALYERGAQLSKVADQWIYYHGFTITKFTIADNGRIDGADTNGCGYEGEISVIAADYNAYRLKLRVNSCYELDGVYEGMAYLLSGLEEDDTLNMQVYTDEQAFYLPIVRDTKSTSPTPQEPT
ncbi:MAG: hypothetical protein GDA45_02875 [Chromatiales bacterium]|nr:hypothetical protein [Chromatiales bacterium]